MDPDRPGYLLADYKLVSAHSSLLPDKVMELAREGYILQGGPFVSPSNEVCQAMVKYEISHTTLALEKMRH